MMTAKVTDEAYCRVVEWKVDGKLDAWNFCVIMGDKGMINAFGGVTEDNKNRADEIAPVDAVPEVEDGTPFEVEIFAVGDP